MHSETVGLPTSAYRARPYYNNNGDVPADIHTNTPPPYKRIKEFSYRFYPFDSRRFGLDPYRERCVPCLSDSSDKQIELWKRRKGPAGLTERPSYPSYPSHPSKQDERTLPEGVREWEPQLREILIGGRWIFKEKVSIGRVGVRTKGKPGRLFYSIPFRLYW